MGEHISLTVNGAQRELDVEPRRLLVQVLREDLDLTGTHVGCDTSQCGACTVHVDGKAVKSCTMLAVQAEGATVTTIEGMAADGGELHPLQQAFWEKHGLQCGFCTPGMIMIAADLLARNPDPTDDEIRHALEGNICRCTGYQNIVAAVREAAADGACAGPRPPPARRRSGEGRIDDRRARRPSSRSAGRSSGSRTRASSPARAATSTTSSCQSMAHMAILRSPYAHANIRSIDTTAGEGDARRRRGVRRRRHPVQPAADGLAGRRQRGHPEQRQHAPHPRHGQRQVDRRGRRGGRRRDRGPGLRRARRDRGRLGAAAGRRRRREGDSAAARRSSTRTPRTTSSSSGPSATRPAPTPPSTSAEVVVRQRIVNQRLIPNPMETRGDIGWYNPGTDEYTIWMSSQTPHIQRLLLAAFVMGVPEHKIRCISPDVGGAFGTKIFCYADYALTLFASKAIGGRPVKWVEGRRENYQSTIHGRDHITYLEIAGKRDGEVTGLRVKTLRQPRRPPLDDRPRHPDDAVRPRPARLLQDPEHLLPRSSASTRTRRSSTPTAAPAGPRRRTSSSGRWTCSPDEIGMDRAEVRRKNFIQPDQFPYEDPSGLGTASGGAKIYIDSGNYEPALDKALATGRLRGPRREEGRGEGPRQAPRAWASAPTSRSAASRRRSGSARSARAGARRCGSRPTSRST